MSTNRLAAAAVAPYSRGLLSRIAAQAPEADRTRSVDGGVIAAIKQSDLIRLSAATDVGGLGAGSTDIAREMEAIAGACGSTAWCLWNHLCVFHLYCAQLGPECRDFLAGIVERREWVTFPQGAGTAMTGAVDGDTATLTGKSTFASGARYGDWAASVFAVPNPDAERPDLRFTVLPLDDPGVSIEPDWNAMSVRASATDTLHVNEVRVPLARVRPWRFDFHQYIRNPEVSVIAHRLREDWVGLAVLWLAAQAVGVVDAALTDAIDQAASRRAIFNARMAERPGVQLNLGHIAANVASARAIYLAGCAETDARIESGEIVDEAGYLRQLGYAMVALELCNDAMQRLVMVLGGNGLRQEGSFERRFRDFQAMPIHITAHPDRVAELCGKFLLGIDQPT